MHIEDIEDEDTIESSIKYASVIRGYENALSLAPKMKVTLCLNYISQDHLVERLINDDSVLKIYCDCADWKQKYSQTEKHAVKINREQKRTTPNQMMYSFEKLRDQMGDEKFELEYQCSVNRKEELYFVTRDKTGINWQYNEQPEKPLGYDEFRDIRYWAEADPDKVYYLVQDTGEGIGKDWTTAFIIEAGGGVVATKQNNTQTVREFCKDMADFIHENEYPVELVAPENNGIGASAVEAYAEFIGEDLMIVEYSALERYQTVGNRKKMGIFQTKDKERNQLQQLKRMLVGGFKVRDEETINEIKKYRSAYAKERLADKSHYDRLSALVLYPEVLNYSDKL